MLGISKIYKEILEQDEKTGGKQGALLLESLAKNGEYVQKCAYRTYLIAGNS